MNDTISPSDVPIKYQNVHDLKVGRYRALFNAKADQYSMAILNKKDYKLYRMINGQKNMQDLCRPRRYSQDQVMAITEYLKSKNIVHFSDQEPEIKLTSGRSASIWLHVSNQCNLRCTYCYIKKTNDHLNVDQGKVYAEKAFAVLQKRGMKRVNVKLAGGEPTLRFEQTIQLTDDLRELGQVYGMVVDVTLLTNGTLLNEHRAKVLKEKNITASVSLDGIDESNNINRPYINGKGSLDKVMDGIALLQSQKVNFNVSVVITPQSIDHFPKVIEFCLQRKMPYLIQFARENTFSIGQVQADNKRLIKGMKKVFKVIANNFPDYSLLHGHLDNVSFSRAHNEPVCGVDNNYIVISDKGEVSACHMFMDKPVGSIMDDDISDKLFTAKTVTNGITSEQKEGCQTCEWRYVCAGSCPATTLLTYGTSARKSPFCQSYKTLIPELIKLEAQRVIHLAQQQ